jgi:formylmethanofuran dehydrogenase subunit E
VKKIPARFPVIEWLGACVKCGETNLAHKFGDEIIEGEPVCVACVRKLRATERSEGARPSEARQR